VGRAIEEQIVALSDKTPAELIAGRRRKFLNMGRKGLAA